jgi:hypothetical protein
MPEAMRNQRAGEGESAETSGGACALDSGIETQARLCWKVRGVSIARPWEAPTLPLAVAMDRQLSLLPRRCQTPVSFLSRSQGP